MHLLGLEGTAHTLGVGILEDNGTILANIMKTYRPKEGIHPREAANHHASNMISTIEEAITVAGIQREDIGLVSFSQGPGLGPCLRTVATAARAMSLSLNVPMVGVNHCIAHIEIGRLTTECSDPVLLYASGGNTQVIAFSRGRYRVFGETLDIGVGNMLDKFGRENGMPFPAGPEIERRAELSNNFIELPYSVKGMDVSFSGILTAALNSDKPLNDLCYSLQETVFAMLTEVAERALAHTGKNEVLLGGGVIRNKRLRDMATIMAKERGAEAYAPPGPLCVDNGAMIAWTGYIMYESGLKTPVDQSGVMQNFRTDEVDITWRK
ncbi:MAG: bifunctional N(6)-L-threonylcarbamoyladenine synthase/serine/threonine protein kinase [Thermoplasmata archaeon]